MRGNYELSLSNFDGGENKYFKTREDALKYFEAHKDEWFFIDLKNRHTGKQERLKESKMRPCYHVRTVYCDTFSYDVIEGITYEEIE